MEKVKFIVKLIVAAFFVLALDLIIPFNTVAGLDYLKANGKWIMVLIALGNVIIGGGISGGFLEKDLKKGFAYWLQPTRVRGSLNPTHCFAAIILVFNVFVVCAIHP